MRVSLQNWINDADSLQQHRFFSIAQMPINLGHIINRQEDYFISLVGELFNYLNSPDTPRADWAQLGNAFLQFSTETSNEQLMHHGISKDDATLYAAASFYFGDFPASACLTMRRGSQTQETQSIYSACFDFLSRPIDLRSQIAINVREFLRVGNQEGINQLIDELSVIEHQALQESPEEWISAKLLKHLLFSFLRSNLRSVLPDGHHEFWTPLVTSLIDRKPSTWEFFPSQIQAINSGLLVSNESYSLQMPTGAGKTTLCEALLYKHLKNNPNHLAIMIVPYRSLASELRGTLVRRLNSYGIASRCAYGGTVPTGDEIHVLTETQVVIATPEALSGLLGADPDFAGRISLVICDEGHLLDGDGRGIGLELLLARLRGRPDNPTKFVFMSAIVPNIEEINAWLGGNAQTVVRSTYRPAIAEFALLRLVGNGSSKAINLELHPHEEPARQFSIDGFLSRQSFTYLNPATGRQNTYDFSSIKSQAIAAARKVLPMGSTAIFALNKRGSQGAIGIAESLVEQLQFDLPIPKPINFVHLDVLQKAIDYLEDEYGENWIGTLCVKNGTVLHHGDIPQETREVLETLIRNQDVKMVICTSTLAEGVNLPIRTLVLYSVQRRFNNGQMQNMLARDIKNLVGRAGRAGANTKGLVICANPDQWHLIQPVALQGAGEPVQGSLLKLINIMTRYVANNNIALSNEFLELNTIIHPLIDGVDSTLIELLSNEIGEGEFIALAVELAAHTFAASQLSAAEATQLRSVFELRARRLIVLRANGKTDWARQTGARIRLIDSVEQRLRPLRDDWNLNGNPLADDVRQVIFQWAWSHSELQEGVKECFRLNESADVETEKDRFFEIARLWMNGLQFKNIAEQVGLSMDDLLTIHSRGISFLLQTIVEQGISLLTKVLEAEGIEISEDVRSFPEYLRFGAPSKESKLLAIIGVRHRNAYVQLGTALQNNNFVGDQEETKLYALSSLSQYSDQWREALGELVYQNTLADL